MDTPVSKQLAAAQEPAAERAGRFDRLKRVGPPLASAAVFGFALYAIAYLLRDLSYRQVMDSLAMVPIGDLALAAAATAACFVVLTGYDWSALRYIGKRLPYQTIALASFCGYAISNTVGVSVVSGGSVRYRIYGAAGLGVADVARVTVFCVLAYGVGITVVGASAFSLYPEVVAVTSDVDPLWLRAIGLAVFAGVAVGLAFASVRRRPITFGRWRVAVPSGGLLIFQLLLSIADISLSGAVLYVLLPETDIPFFGFLSIYAIATVAGIMSHVPGGLGVVEGVVLFAIGERIPAESVVAALLAFRAIFFLLPLCFAVVVLVANEVSQKAGHVLERARGTAAWNRRTLPTALALLIVFAGFLLLAAAATPSDPARLAAIAGTLPLMAVEIAHFLAAIAGLGLIFVSQGLYRRLDRAFWMACALLPAGAILSLSWGFAAERAVLLVISLVLLLPCREEFYRQASLFDTPIMSGWVVAACAAIGSMFWLVFFSFRPADYGADLWSRFAYDLEAARAFRAALGVAVCALAVIGVSLIRKPKIAPVASDPSNLARAAIIAQRQDQITVNLLFRRNNLLLFDGDGEAFLMFAERGRSWIALGDPAGPRIRWGDLAWTFCELADRAFRRPAFYGVRPENLPLYLDLGLMPLMVAEEAVIPLKPVSQPGDVRAPIASGPGEGQRQEFSIEVTSAERLKEMLAGAERTELLSAGLSPAVDRDLVPGVPHVLLRWRDRPVAVTTLLTSNTKAEAAVGPIHLVPSAPEGTLALMVARLIDYARGQGFATFSLGMAPLNGVAADPLVPLGRRFGPVIFEHGEHFDALAELRAFKTGFEPVWQPRYLVADSRADPLAVMNDAAAAIAGPLRGGTSGGERRVPH